MDMIGRIRRLHHSRGKKSEWEISRMTGLSCNTIAKWLKVPLDGEPKYRRSAQPGKLTAFHEVLKQEALKADPHRPKHERRTARGGAVQRDQGGRLRGRLQPRDGLHPSVAPRRGAGDIDPCLCALVI